MHLDGFIAIQWHDDAWELPVGAELLASSPAWSNQAFRYGPDVLALQFHLEFTQPHMAWAVARPGEEESADPEREDRAAFASPSPRYDWIKSSMVKVVSGMLDPARSARRGPTSGGGCAFQCHQVSQGMQRPCFVNWTQPALQVDSVTGGRFPRSREVFACARPPRRILPVLRLRLLRGGMAQGSLCGFGRSPVRLPEPPRGRRWCVRDRRSFASRRREYRAGQSTPAPGRAFPARESGHRNSFASRRNTRPAQPRGARDEGAARAPPAIPNAFAIPRPAPRAFGDR